MTRGDHSGEEDNGQQVIFNLDQSIIHSFILRTRVHNLH